MRATELKAEKIANEYAERNNELIEKFFASVLKFDNINRLAYVRLARGLTKNILKALFDIADYAYEHELYAAQIRKRPKKYHIDDELIYAMLVKSDIDKLVNKNVLQWMQDLEIIKTSGKANKIPREEIRNLMRAKTGTIGECGLTYQIMRILRTETNSVVNQASVKAYEDAGTRHYKFCAILDNRECTKCHELNGKIFEVSKAKRGENLPSMHPNCRCHIEPVGTPTWILSFAEWQKLFLD